MKIFFEMAIANINSHGDTDIFPFPIENHILYGKSKEVVSLLLDIDANFNDRLAEFPPANYSALAPVGYTGFRWATQLDPVWNAYFLGLVLSISEDIEAARVTKKDDVIFSYRYEWDKEKSDLFDNNYNWRAFMERTEFLAKENKFVVLCDISEFYPRLNHHRLENALKQLNLKGDQPHKIMEFLKNFSGTYSFGLPIGGPAARILSELLLNQIDRLLHLEGIKFCRFADDYHLFFDSHEESFRGLVFLSERLLQNQGLQLQKTKTKIMSGAEFIATNPLSANDDRPAIEGTQEIREQSQNLMRLSIRFDPYSPTASDDFELLKSELKKFDIMSILKTELVKSRIHVSLARKIVSAIRYIDATQRNSAVLSLIKNQELLYPIYANVLLVAKSLFEELDEDTRVEILSHVRGLVKARSQAVIVDLNLAYAVRLLSCASGPENEEVLARIYKETSSIIVRRDIILAMAKWKAWYWVSDLRNDFRTMGAIERRAFLVASFALTDEGGHWRSYISRELSPFEKLVKTWASDKANLANWSIPL